MTMKLIVTGPRVFDHRAKFMEGMATVPRKPRVTTIITADAYGVEALAKRYANDHGIDWQHVRPNFKKHGAIAYHRNHKHMVKAADAAIVFTDNLCNYTHGFLAECRKRKLPFITFDIYGYTRP